MLDDAPKALESGDFETALAAYDKLVRVVEGSQEVAAYYMRPTVYTGRARALAGMQEYEAAIEDFKRATDINADFVPALVARGEMYLEVGAADQALPDFQKAVKAERSNLQAQFGLGKALIQLGGWQQGIGPLTRVLTADPKNAEAYRLRGSGYAGVFKFDKSIADLQEAINLNPQDYEAYFTLGVVYLRDEKYQDSVDQLGKAIETYVPKPGQEEEPYCARLFDQGRGPDRAGQGVEGPGHEESGLPGGDRRGREAAEASRQEEPVVGANPGGRALQPGCRRTHGRQAGQSDRHALRSD